MSDEQKVARDRARQRVVVLAGSVAALSASAPLVTRHFPRLGVVWFAMILVALIYVIWQFAKAYRMPR